MRTVYDEIELQASDACASEQAMNRLFDNLLGRT